MNEYQHRKPFFQGKIDNFCAIYAVLNALHLLYALTPFQARDIFNQTLLGLAPDPAKFTAVLRHTTDYVQLVDEMFFQLGKVYTLLVDTPFAPNHDKKDVWESLARYADPAQGRTAVFRFCRYTPFRAAPVADHWSTTLVMENRGLRLFDCSLEPGGLYYLKYEAMAQTPALHKDEYFIIPSESVRLISAGGNFG